jgi:hypothetical protein
MHLHVVCLMQCRHTLHHAYHGNVSTTTIIDNIITHASEIISASLKTGETSLNQPSDHGHWLRHVPNFFLAAQLTASFLPRPQASISLPLPVHVL